MAQAAVSGAERGAALPRNRLAYFTGKAPPAHRRDSRRCLRGVARSPQAVQGVEHDPVSSESSSPLTRVCRRPGRRAAGCGWKCFSSRAGAPCHGRRTAPAGRDVRSCVFAFDPVVPGLAGACEEVFQASPSRDATRRGWLPVCRCRYPVRQAGLRGWPGDVAPHFRVAAGDTGEIAKAVPAKRKKVSASGRAASSSISAKAARCGRWLTAANTRSWSPSVMRATRAVQAIQRLSNRATSSGGFPAGA